MNENVFIFFKRHLKKIGKKKITAYHISFSRIEKTMNENYDCRWH